MRGKALTEFILAVFATVLLYFIICLFISLYIVKRKKQRTREMFEKVLLNSEKSTSHDYAKRCISRIDTLKREMKDVFYTESFDNLKLCAYYVPCGRETDTFVLLVHGYDSDAFTAFGSQITFYKDLGFDTLVIDQRSCGASEGKYITFAVNESRDVATWCRFIVQKFKNCKKIVLHGISLGGASVLFSLDRQLPSEVKCVIDDCGFNSPEGIIHHVLEKDFHFPAFMRKTVVLFCEMICKCKFRNANTEDILKKSDIPILFVHGALDTYVPYYMSESNYKAAKTAFEFHTVEDAHHANSFICDEFGCYNAVKRLLNETLN